MSDRARYWQRLVTAWGKSGLSQAEFCRRREVKAVNFGWWKRKRARKHQRTYIPDTLLTWVTRLDPGFGENPTSFREDGFAIFAAHLCALIDKAIVRVLGACGSIRRTGLDGHEVIEQSC